MDVNCLGILRFLKFLWLIAVRHSTRLGKAHDLFETRVCKEHGNVQSSLGSPVSGKVADSRWRTVTFAALVTEKFVCQ